MPESMVDCVACGAQNWELDEQEDTLVRFTCNTTGCDGVQSFALGDGVNGYDCIACGYTTWQVAEKRADHVIFRCTECDEETEVWLQEEGN